MLKSLSLWDWKSFGEARNTLKLSPLTLLVGPNASGKSNALDALRFLQGVALDYPFGDVLRGRWEGQREIWPAIRGQDIEAARSGYSGFWLETQWDFRDLNPNELPVEHSLSIDTQKDAVLDNERVSRPDGNYAFATHAPALRATVGRQEGGAIKAALRSKGKGNAVVQTYSAARSLLGQVTEGGRIHQSAVEDARLVRGALRSIAFLDIQPSRMRDYKPEYANVLGNSGENISPKLHALPPKQLEDIVGWLSELCAPALDGILFDATTLKEVMFFLKEGETMVSARSVSDGTLRFLGLVTALLTAQKGSMIVLEEPDVGLHPARIHLLARLLEQTTQSGEVQVLATTHSATLLAHLQPESLANVVALGRDAEGITVCERIGDLEHFATLRESEQLDHLVSTGWIERAL